MRLLKLLLELGAVYILLVKGREQIKDPLVPKVACNCLSINDGFGAIAAVAETQDGFRYVPKGDSHAHIKSLAWRPFCPTACVRCGRVDYSFNKLISEVICLSPRPASAP